MASDVTVFAELFDLNLREEIGGRGGLTSKEMHTAFVHALHATVCDMPRLAGCEEARALCHDEPERPAPRKGLRFAIITLKAAIVAGLFRIAIFLGTGH